MNLRPWGCSPVGTPSLRAPSLTPEAEPSWAVLPVSPVTAGLLLTVVQRAEPVRHLGDRPASGAAGVHPGVVLLREVARLHGEVAGLPADLLAALLRQPLSLPVPASEGGAGAHLSPTGLASGLWFINNDSDIECLLSTFCPRPSMGMICESSLGSCEVHTLFSLLCK